MYFLRGDFCYIIYNMSRIVIVEDDATMRSALSQILSEADFEPVCFSDFALDAPHFVEKLLATSPDLILLDLHLPDHNGAILLRLLRKSSQVPVVMITSSNSEADEMITLDFGADDYITKPFNPQLLLLHIEAVLRRGNNQPSTVKFHDLTIDLLNGSIKNAIKTLELTKNEMVILRTLLRTPGKIVSRETLMTELWHNQEYINDNALTVNISRLRTKFAKLGLEEAIVSRKGLGYILQ